MRASDSSPGVIRPVSGTSRETTATTCPSFSPVLHQTRGTDHLARHLSRLLRPVAGWHVTCHERGRRLSSREVKQTPPPLSWSARVAHTQEGSAWTGRGTWRTVKLMASAHPALAPPPETWWLELRRLLLAVLDLAADPVADAGLELTLLDFDIQLVLDGYHPLHGRTPPDLGGVGASSRSDASHAAPVAGWLVVARAANVLGVVRYRLQVHAGEDPGAEATLDLRGTPRPREAPGGRPRCQLPQEPEESWLKRPPPRSCPSTQCKRSASSWVLPSAPPPLRCSRGLPDKWSPGEQASRSDVDGHYA